MVNESKGLTRFASMLTGVVAAWAAITCANPPAANEEIYRPQLSYEIERTTNAVQIPGVEIFDMPRAGKRTDTRSGMTQNGDIYVVGGGLMWKSEDRGETWIMGEVPQETAGGFGILHNDTFILQYAEAPEYENCFVIRSTDYGQTWSEPAAIDISPYNFCPGGWADVHQHNENEVLITMTLRKQGEMPFHDYVIRSTDGGVTWTQKNLLLPFSAETSIATIDGSDRMLAIVRGQRHASENYGLEADPPNFDETTGAGKGNPWPLKNAVLVESEDGGRTWTNPKLFDTYGSIPGEILSLPDGRVAAVWVQRYPEPEAELRVRISRDGGRTWGSPTYALSKGMGYPSSVVYPDGTIVTVCENTQLDASGHPLGERTMAAVRWRLPVPQQEGVLFEDDFESVESVLSLDGLPGWRIRSGGMKVVRTVNNDETIIKGNLSPIGEDSYAVHEFGQRVSRGKLVLTFDAARLEGSHNSSVGFAVCRPDGDVQRLVGWAYKNSEWWFDARGITVESAGQMQRLQKIYGGPGDREVSCRIVVDSGGRWVWGELIDAEGQTHKTNIYELPTFNETLADSIYIRQCREPENGPINVDNVRLTFENAPPLDFDRKRLPDTVIEYGWTSPDTTYFSQNLDEIEKLPLDGVTIRVSNPRFPNGTLLNGVGRGDAGWQSFQNLRIPREEIIDPAIEDLHSLRSDKLRSNYLCVVSYLPNQQTMDWFDDEWWGNIAHNMSMLAEVAKKGDLEGIMFDPEEYGCRFWSIATLKEDPLYTDRTGEEIVAKVRQRGREFIRAINSQFPGIHVFVLHAWERVIWEIADDFERLPNAEYGLLIAFLDGMLEAADDNTILIDGIENGYYLEGKDEFAKRVDRVLRYGPLISAVPDHFRAKVRTGFGIWIDRDFKWHPDDIEKNYWSPQQISNNIRDALEASDGFVWLYTERVTFWLDSPNAELGGGITLGTGLLGPKGEPGYYDWRNEEVKWMPYEYMQAIKDAQ